MTFINGRAFADAQIFVKVELALTLELFFNIWIFSIQINIDKLQPKVLPNVIFHTVWSRLCRVQNLKKEKKRN